MKRLFYIVCLMTAFAATAAAQKKVYIPDEWRWNSSLYAESDPDGTHTWSKSRSVENDDIVIFWDNGYTTKPNELPRSDFYYIDLDDLMRKCQSFYDLEYRKLGFVDTLTTNLNKYKMMVLLLHTDEWSCYGSGYDFEVNALWVNPQPCHPVGHSVAHEVGHSFHYMCYAAACGHNHQSSTTIGTGFHLAVGNGQTIWEQTAQWQANQSYPAEMFNQSIGVFRNSHNYAFSHEWHRYQSYWFHYYLCQHYDDITTVAQVWRQPMTGAVDFNQSLMALKQLTPRDLYRLYFDYACRCATWDFDACAPYRNNYIGDFNYRCVLTDEGEYQVAHYSCPQSTGFNVIPLQVPAPGTEVVTHLTGLAVGAPLLDADPGEYLNGDTGTSTTDNRHYVNGGPRASRGFRMGYVALMDDGSRQYFAADSVYCQGTRLVTEDYAFRVPEGVSRLWLVVAPALKTYFQHKWDETIDHDDMWPYRFSIEGTDIGARALVYANPTLDGRDIADATFTYDVTFPADANEHSGTSVTVSGRAAATLGTAFQLQLSSITTKMQEWSTQGPANGRIMFYAVRPTGELAPSGSTANGYGHWFTAAGNVCQYSSGTVYSEFLPSSMTFYLGQYPGRCTEGKTYTVRQALRYRKNPKEYAQATFVFNITVGPAASAMLRSIDYADPSTQGIQTMNYELRTKNCYDLQGRPADQPARGGIYISDGRKVVVR